MALYAADTLSIEALERVANCYADVLKALDCHDACSRK
ncbi:hypothetical protein CES86_1436 [Brucella lupini]|uniref:Uncharacterized protein n=1 Tax=Brucella lupini TaxID=255457 RepID=A0A256GV27_9HYPH|nr:hypothetical protein CES86_1436 [Brucella lupini]